MKASAIVAGIVAAIFLIVGVAGCKFTTPESGEVGVVRNGGPFDSKSIRGIVDNGSGNTWAGMFSEVHYYPVSDQQRLFTFKDGEYDPDKREWSRAEGADSPAIEVPTADGVRVRIEGTIYLNTAFDSTDVGHDLVKKFDTQFGTRKFNGKHAWDNGGWPNFLAANVEPVIDSNFREVVGGFQCRDLQPSCALVQQTTGDEKAPKVDPNAKSKVTQVQDRINAVLGGDPAIRTKGELELKLGHPYFKNVRFSLGRVRLPGVQASIDKAQAAFADVSTAQAKVNAASKEAQANENRQRGYVACSTCARLDAIRAQAEVVRAIPNGLQVYAPGGGVGINVGGGK